MKSKGNDIVNLGNHTKTESGNQSAHRKGYAPHPSWCAGTEPAGQDHASAILHAAAPTDCADIRIRIEELRTTDGLRTPLLFLDFIEDQDDENEEPYVCPLLLPQARLLADSLTRLLDTYDHATGSF